MNGTRALLLGLLVLLPLDTGCATAALWEEPRFDPGDAPPTSSLTPRYLVQAVRTGDGAHHLLVRMSDGSSQQYLVEPPSAQHTTWPSAATDALPAPIAVWTGMPVGVPLAVETAANLPPWTGEPPPTPDATLAVLVDAGADPDPDEPRVRLDGRRVLLTTPDGQDTTLAEFPRPTPAPPRPAPPSGVAHGVRRVGGVTVKLALTPFALAVDTVIGAGVVAGLTLLFPLLPFITFC